MPISAILALRRHPLHGVGDGPGAMAAESGWVRAVARSLRSRYATVAGAAKGVSGATLR